MTQHKRRVKTLLALVFAFIAAFPVAAASAHVNPVGRGEQPEVLPQDQPPIVQVVSSSHGFDWSDAGIGAAGGLGLSMIALGGGVFLVQRRHHHPGHMTAPAI